LCKSKPQKGSRGVCGRFTAAWPRFNARPGAELKLCQTPPGAYCGGPALGGGRAAPLVGGLGFLFSAEHIFRFQSNYYG